MVPKKKIITYFCGVMSSKFRQDRCILNSKSNKTKKHQKEKKNTAFLNNIFNFAKTKLVFFLQTITITTTPLMKYRIDVKKKTRDKF